MKTFRNFINEKLNYNEITEQSFLELLDKNCKKYILKFEDENGEYLEYTDIFRKSDYIGDYLYINPKSSSDNRIAPFAGHNYYNLFLSNTDSWKKWPRRNKSLCCASENRAAGHSGGNTLYVVIPYDDTKIGISSRSDFWDSFERLGNKTNPIAYWFAGLMYELDNMNSPLSMSDWYKVEKTDQYNWIELKSLLESVTPTEKIKKSFFNRGGYVYDDNYSLLINMDRFFEPRVNGFKLLDSIQTLKKFSKINPEEASEAKECWMEDPVLCIKSDLYMKTFEKMNKD